MIQYVKGDLFDHILHKKVMITHICNDVGGWGSGFVIPLAIHFPIAQQRYLQWFQVGNTISLQGYQEFALGKTQIIRTNNIYISNMIAQRDIVSKINVKPIRYAALIHCMNYVADFCEKNDVPIHAPKFGSGLAGGNWDFIEQLIIALWIDKGINVTIYELEESKLISDAREDYNYGI